VTVIDDFAPDAVEPTMENVRMLAEAIKRNKGDIMQLDLPSKIQQLGWMADNEEAPAEVREAARKALQMAAESSRKFVAKKIKAAVKRAEGRARNPLARDGTLSPGTVRSPAAQQKLRHAGRPRTPIRC